MTQTKMEVVFYGLGILLISLAILLMWQGASFGTTEASFAIAMLTTMLGTTCISIGFFMRVQSNWVRQKDELHDRRKKKSLANS
ncbi:hypothetical protein FLK61_26665 [Paenalkalicoccus suaedae]|uniref:Uncharacterized protein n=1 Tax=Paenalkalicoccus suaedae TaxID=2592382 RepID=A0A859FC67_9BACI|nr:hypothetical protein [Paenalkalicoccus suaedae]QKS70341.1 hypothetical protein FLK61_26665 [Paenalkalicoccus suaedae]